MPRLMSNTPAISVRSSDSCSAQAETAMPKDGVASNAIAIVLARKWLPASTIAQYVKSVAIRPT
jgi:hypothetical protein